MRLGEESYMVLSFPLGAPILPENLSPAEREILAAVLEGATYAEIARVRGTSARTVSNQVAALFAKLGVRSRVELAAWLAAGGVRGSPRTSGDGAGGVKAAPRRRRRV
jgi:DNA-binding CsgD family transcriptional regulator